MTWQLIVDLIASVPNVVWSGVVASVLTLSGVFISNGSHTKRLRMQHEHEAREKARERLFQARRETYMRVAEQFSLAMAHLGTLPVLTPSKDNLTAPLQAFNATAAKVQLIAGSDTADLAAEAGHILTDLYFTLIAEAQPIYDKAISVDLCVELCDRAQAELERILAQQRILIESPAFTPEALQPLKESFSHTERLAREHIQARNAAIEERLRLQSAYTAGLPGRLRPLANAQIPLLMALRRELELGSNEERLILRTESGLKHFGELLKKHLGPLV